jgi:hypothetical protein
VLPVAYLLRVEILEVWPVSCKKKSSFVRGPVLTYCSKEGTVIQWRIIICFPFRLLFRLAASIKRDLFLLVLCT